MIRLLALVGILVFADSAAAAKPNLSGLWKLSEQGVLRATVNGNFTERYAANTEYIILRHNGNRVYYSHVLTNPITGVERRVRLEGTVYGDRIVFRGIAMLPAPGITFTRNSMVTTARVVRNTRTIQGETIVHASFSGMGSTAVIEGGTAMVMHSKRHLPELSASNPEQGRLQHLSGIKFPSPVKGGKPAVKTITIDNNGQALLRWSAECKGRDPEDFHFLPRGPMSLKPGGTATIKVIFRPTARGTRKARIWFHTNDPEASRFAFNLGGTGIPGELWPVATPPATEPAPPTHPEPANKPLEIKPYATPKTADLPVRN